MPIPEASDVPKPRQARRQSHRGLAQMASEFGISMAQSERVSTEPAGNEEATDDRCAGLQARRGSARLRIARAVEESTRIAFRWRKDQGRARRRAGKTGRIGDCGGDVAVEMQRIAPDQRTGMPDLPPLVDETIGQPLAAGLPPEHEDAATEKTRARGELDASLAPQPHSIE